MAPPVTDADIDSFIEFTSNFDKHLAVRFIQGASGNVEQAVQNYYDNPGRYDTESYDETAFSQDRDGGGYIDQDSLPVFQIHAPDEPPQSYSHSSAPTRPPSRASHHGMSNSTEMQQETGVVGASGAYFGPANRDHYDPSSWALTRLGVAESEVYPDVDVTLRARVAGEPVMIKPFVPAAELPSLLTILVTIPLALEMLLAGGDVSQNHNSSEELHSSDSSMAEIKMTSTEEAEPANTNGEELRKMFVQQVAELAASMVGTIRSYEDIDRLWKFKTSASSYDGSGDLPSEWFLEKWTRAVKEVTGREEAAKAFEAFGMIGPFERENEWDPNYIPVYNLYTPKQNGDEKPTLYDAFDYSIWGLDTDNSTLDRWFHQVPDILVVHAVQDDPAIDGLNIQVPASFFMDRYMLHNVLELRRIRQQRNLHDEEISSIRKKIDRFTEFDFFDVAKQREVVPTNDAQLTLTESIASLKRTQDWKDPIEAELISHLELLNNKIDVKVQQLKKQIDEVNEAMKAENGILKEANPVQGPRPSKLYTLRGVSPSISTTFVLYPSADNPEGLEWWRLEYTSAPEIIKAKVTEQEVLDAAVATSREVTLVFATEEACKANPKLNDWNYLNPTLQEHIKSGNEAFDAELKKHETQSANDWANSTAMDNAAGDPPPYDANDSQESFEWSPDPGANVISDSDFPAWSAQQRALKAVGAISLTGEKSQIPLPPPLNFEDTGRQTTSGNGETSSMEVEFSAAEP